MARPYCTTCGRGGTHQNDKTGDTKCEKHVATRPDKNDYYVIKE